MITAEVISAFEQALIKTALSATPLLQRGKQLGSMLTSPMAGRIGAGTMGGAGAGAVGGGLLGAAGGAVGDYRQARAQGASSGEALQAGLAGGLQGAQTGLARGLALGAAGGAAGGALNKNFSSSLAKAPIVGGGARFGQRQLHGLTGWVPEEGLRSIHGGAYKASKGVEEAAEKLRKTRASAEQNMGRAVEGLEASAEAERRGLTSIPGYVKALREDPKGTLQAGLREQWAGQSPGMRMLGAGMAGAGLVSEVRGREEGVGVGEGIGRALGGTAPWMMGPLPTAASLALTPVGGFAGGLAGRGVDRLRRRSVGRVPAQGPGENPVGQAAATEHVFTDRAQGAGPEGVSA